MAYLIAAYVNGPDCAQNHPRLTTCLTAPFCSYVNRTTRAGWVKPSARQGTHGTHGSVPAKHSTLTTASVRRKGFALLLHPDVTAEHTWKWKKHSSNTVHLNEVP